MTDSGYDNPSVYCEDQKLLIRNIREKLASLGAIGMSGKAVFRLTSLEFFAEPFLYFTATEGFGEGMSSAILEWLETGAPWELVETDFYEQYEFSSLSRPDAFSS